jgi:hypothetical protein
MRIPLVGMVLINCGLLWVAPAARDRSAATTFAPVLVSTVEGGVAIAAPASVVPDATLPAATATPPEVGERIEFADLIETDDANGPRQVAPWAVQTPPQTFAVKEQAGDEKAAPATPTDGPASADLAGVVLENAAGSTIAVGFLANGVEYWLEPGQQLRLTGSSPFEVVFDRGGKFGVAHEMLPPGRYGFRVTEQGWTLESAHPQAAPKGNLAE